MKKEEVLTVCRRLLSEIGYTPHVRLEFLHPEHEETLVAFGKDFDEYVVLGKIKRLTEEIIADKIRLYFHKKMRK